MEMPNREIAGKVVPVNEEGFLTDLAAWNEEIAAQLAREAGIAELTPAHWQVIEFCRKDATATGQAPTLRRITTSTGISTKELFSLFPRGPAKKAAKISGLRKPEGCV
jgi:tRNA 2-thiouridine synthesizing protein E